MPIAVAETHKKCRITLVTPGSSDRVIDVYPAEKESEKIWLDNTPGIERWEAVERLLNQYAERGTRVPKPAPYHNDGKFNRPTLDEQDIPLVRLQGAVLEALPEPEKIIPKPPANQADVDARFKLLSEQIQNLAAAVSSMSNMKIGSEAPRVKEPDGAVRGKKRGRPAKITKTTEEPCPEAKE